jgi:hypothetical protein
MRRTVEVCAIPMLGATRTLANVQQKLRRDIEEAA